MSIHFNKMTDEQKLEWLKLYEKQNPVKYLRKFGKVTAKFPPGHPQAGQPSDWDYIPPEEAIKKIAPSFQSSTGGVNVEISEKDKVVQEMEMVTPPAVTPLVEAPVKRGRKPKNV